MTDIEPSQADFPVPRPENSPMPRSRLLPTADRGWFVPCLVFLTVSSSLTAVAEAATAPVVGIGSGLAGTYYDNQDFSGTSVTRIDPTIDFAWGTRAPIVGIAPTTYSVVWSGYLQPQYSETYTLTTISDDGVLLMLDDQLVISNWTDHGQTTNSVARTLTAGKKYRISLRYYQNGGDSVIKFQWSSPSTPLAAVPQTQLYPDPIVSDPPVLAITSPLASRTSPAWLEGTAADPSAPVHVMANGAVAVVRTEALGRWYGTRTGPENSPGIDLDPAAPTTVELVNGSAQNYLASQLIWQVTDLGNLPYGLDQLTIRQGDSLLLTSSGPGKQLTLTATSVASSPQVVFSRATAPGTASVATFPKAGLYDATATIDGRAAGHLRVQVVAVDLQGPIACELGYRRVKDIATVPLGVVGTTVAVTSDDPDQLVVSSDADVPIGRRLGLLPLYRGTCSLQARLQDGRGPVIAEQRLYEFTITTDASKEVQIVQQYPDGSLLTKATMTMTPLVHDLDVVLRGFIAGITFEDSTTVKTVSSNLFHDQGPFGTYLYYLLRAPTAHGHLCHTITVYQRGVQVSR